METIKEFLDSDIYLEFIKELGSDNFNKELQSVEIELLKDCLKQRQFLLEGFKCKLYSEKELVEFYKMIIEENYRDIIITVMMRSKNSRMENFPKARRYRKKKSQ